MNENLGKQKGSFLVGLKNLWKYFTLFEKLLFVLCIGLSVAILLLDDGLEGGDTRAVIGSIVVVMCLISGVICEILVTKQNRTNFYFSIVNDVAEGVACLGLFGSGILPFSAIMNFLFWVPNDIISIFKWKKHKKEDKPSEVKVRNLKWWHFVILFVGVAILAYPLSLLFPLIPLEFGEEANKWALYFDAYSALLEISSGLLILLRFREYAIVWAVNTIIDATMYFVDEIPVLGIMNLAYLVLAVYGYLNWTKAITEEKAKHQGTIEVYEKGKLKTIIEVNKEEITTENGLKEIITSEAVMTKDNEK